MQTAEYRRVADALRARLAAGEWTVGDYIPGISALMEQYNVRSLNTIRGAHAVLNEEGLLVAEPGRGVRVVALPTGAEKRQTPQELVSEIRRLLALLEQQIKD